jgi:hypothetical protein
MPHSPGYDRVDVHIDPVAGQASARSRRSWFVPPLVLASPQLVEHDGAAGSYWLPADHAAWLARAAGIDNLATGMQYIGLMAQVEDRIVDCSATAAGC